MSERRRALARGTSSGDGLIPFDLAVCIVEEWVPAAELERLDDTAARRRAVREWAQARRRYRESHGIGSDVVWSVSRPVFRHEFDAWPADARERFVKSARTPARSLPARAPHRITRCIGS